MMRGNFLLYDDVSKIWSGGALPRGHRGNLLNFKSFGSDSKLELGRG